MKSQRHTTEQIIAKLRRADVELGKQRKVPEVCRLLEITEQTYYRWRQKYGGMAPTMAKELKALQQENAQVEEVGGEPGLGHGDSAGGRSGKLVSSRRRTSGRSAEVRRRLGPNRDFGAKSLSGAETTPRHATLPGSPSGRRAATPGCHASLDGRTPAFRLSPNS